MIESFNNEINENFSSNEGLLHLEKQDVEYLRGVQELYADQWNELSQDVRLSALNDFECRMAEIMGRSPYEVVAGEMPFEQNADTKLEDGNIQINPESLANNEKRQDIINSVANVGNYAHLTDLGLAQRYSSPQIKISFGSSFN